MFQERFEEAEFWAAEFLAALGNELGKTVPPIQLTVEWNTRLRTTIAQAAVYSGDEDDGDGWVWHKGFVELNPKIYPYANEEIRRNTIAHEVCHIVADTIHSRFCYHRKPWKRLMKLLGEDASTSHEEVLESGKPS